MKLENKNCKVAVIVPSDSTHITTRAGYVNKLGFENQVIRYQQRYLGIWQRMVNDLTYIRKLRSVKAHVFHAHYAIADSTILAAVAGKFPLIISTMGADILLQEQGDPTIFMRKLLPKLLDCADTITVKSNFNRNVVLSLGIDQKKIALISWGVDQDVFHPQNADNVKDDRLKGKKILLQPRGLPAVYNNDLLLDALQRLVQNGLTDFVVWFPKAAESLEISEFMEKVVAKGLKDYIVVTGSLDAQEMNDAYNVAHCTLSIAASDGLPMTIPESLATGTPVIVGKLPHLTSELQNEGIIWTELTANDLCDNIKNVLENPPMPAKQTMMIKNVKHAFDLENDLLQLQSIYNHAKVVSYPKNRITRIRILLLLIANNFTRSLSKLVGRKKMNNFFVQQR